MGEVVSQSQIISRGLFTFITLSSDWSIRSANIYWTPSVYQALDGVVESARNASVDGAEGDLTLGEITF